MTRITTYLLYPDLVQREGMVANVASVIDRQEKEVKNKEGAKPILAALCHVTTITPLNCVCILYLLNHVNYSATL